MNKIFIASFFSFLSFAAYADECDKACSLLQKYKEEHGLKGTGHIFKIIIACDSKRLSEISSSLQEDEIKIIEYNLIMVVNTKDGSKSEIIESNLSQDIKSCILTQYHKDMKFTPYAPDIMNESIQFPVALQKDKEPVVFNTPIGFVY